MRKVMLNTIKIILCSMETELRKQLKSVLNEYYIGYIIKDEVIHFVREVIRLRELLYSRQISRLEII